MMSPWHAKQTSSAASPTQAKPTNKIRVLRIVLASNIAAAAYIVRNT